MKRSDVGALAQGALVGALVAVLAVLLCTAAARPAEFPTSAAALPSALILPAPTPVPELPLTLESDGLGIMGFGQEGDAVVGELEVLLGPPNGDEHWTCPDPPGELHFVQWADFGVFVIDGVFVGWVDALFYPPAYGELLGLKTTEDLRIGVELEHFEAHLGDRFVFTETPPDAPEGAREFDIDGPTGIHGLVQAGEGASLVIGLSAGTTCFDAP